MTLKIFPTTIHKIDVKDFNKNEIIDFCYKEKENFPNGICKSNLGNSWHSNINIASYKNIISKTLQQSIFNYFEVNNIFRDRTSIDIRSCWININSKGGYNVFHNHPGCDLSGVFWIKIPKDGGKLIFNNLNAFSEIKLLKSYSSNFKKEINSYEFFEINPIEGVMAIFPAHLWHKVAENYSKEDRISVSFNINITPPPLDNT